MIYGKKKNNFLNELNTVSKTKDEVEKERIVKEKRERDKHIEEEVQRNVEKIKNRIMYMAEKGDFTQQLGKKIIVFAIPVEFAVTKSSTYRDTWKGRIYPNTYTVDGQLASKIFEAIKACLAEDGINCEKIGIHYQKKVMHKYGSGVKEYINKYYELKSGENYYEYDGGYTESYELIVEGKVIY